VRASQPSDSACATARSSATVQLLSCETSRECSSWSAKTRRWPPGGGRSPARKPSLKRSDDAHRRCPHRPPGIRSARARRAAAAARARWRACPRRGTGMAATRARVSPAAVPAPARAAALGADGAPESARPGRPPSRRRSRPRAEGTSGSGAGHRARAVQALMFAMTGTCVRKLRRSSDGLCANMRTHRAGAAKTALRCRSCRLGLQRPLRGGRSAELGEARAASHAGRSTGG
jgi:hypothetical protein